MHRLPSSGSVSRFRLAALLLVLEWLLVASALGLLGVALVFALRDFALLAISLGGSGLLLWLSHWALSRRARCPLCLVPSFSHQRCTRSPKARRLFGSYPLFVAVTVMFKGSFRCPFCGEATAMQERRRHARHAARTRPIRN